MDAVDEARQISWPDDLHPRLTTILHPLLRPSDGLTERGTAEKRVPKGIQTHGNISFMFVVLETFFKKNKAG